MACVDYQACQPRTLPGHPDHDGLVLLAEDGLSRPGDHTMPYSDDFSLGYLPDCGRPFASGILKA
jgi:hypothetical protein